MAESGFIEGKFIKNNLNLNLFLYYTYTQNVNNNTTTLTATLKVKRERSYAETHGNNIGYSITVNGQTKKGSIDFDCRKTVVGNYITIAKYENVSITHNSDGTKSISLGAVFDLSDYSPGKGTVNGSITLKAIPRESTLTFNNGTNFRIGDAVRALININNESFIHKITIKLNDDTNCNTGEINLIYDQDKSIAINIPDAWKNSNIYKTSLSSNGTIELSTYSDTKLIGTKTYDVTFLLEFDTDYINTGGCYYTISNLSKNIISIESSKTYSTFLVNKTKCNISFIVSSNENTEIESVTIIDSNGYSESISISSGNRVNFLSPILSNVGNISYKAIIVDSRGVESTMILGTPITVKEYTLPSLNSILTKRAGYVAVDNNESTELTELDDGKYVKSIIDFSWFDGDSSNTISTIRISFIYDDGFKYEKIYYYDRVNEMLIDNNDLNDITYNIVNGIKYFTIYTLYWNKVANRVDSESGFTYNEPPKILDFNIDKTYEIEYEIKDKYGGVSTRIDTLSTAYCIMDIANEGKSIAFGKTAEDGIFGMEIAMPLTISISANNVFKYTDTNVVLNDKNLRFIVDNIFDNNSNEEIIISNSICSNIIFLNAVEILNIKLENEVLDTGVFGKITFASSNTGIETEISDKLFFVGDNCANGKFNPVPAMFYTIDYTWAFDKVLCKVHGMQNSNFIPVVTEPEPEVEPEDTPPTIDNKEELNGNTVLTDFSHAEELVNNAISYWNVCGNAYNKSNIWSSGMTYRSSNTPASGECVSSVGVTNSLWKNCNGQYYKAIDCSTLVTMSLQDYKYEDSPYYSKTKFDSYRAIRKQPNPKSTWGFYTAREAANIAKFFYEQSLNSDKGIYYYKDVVKNLPATGNLDNLKVGDLLFFSKKENGDYKQKDRFNYISHVAIVRSVDKDGNVKLIESTNATVKTHIVSGTTYNAGIIIRSIEKASPEYITMAVRIQDSLVNKLRSN